MCLLVAEALSPFCSPILAVCALEAPSRSEDTMIADSAADCSSGGELLPAFSQHVSAIMLLESPRSSTSQ